MSLFFGENKEFYLENYVYSQKILRIIDKDTLEKSLDKIIEKQDIDFYHYDDIEIITENKLKVKNGNQFTIIFFKIIFSF